MRERILRCDAEDRPIVIVNQQKRVALDLADLRAYVRRVRSALKMGKADFNVCFVDDDEIRRLNSEYRGKQTPTDVLSFAWQAEDESGPEQLEAGEFEGFCGDIVISVDTAARNARTEGHSTQEEIRLLILHGALHLLGYDHATDQGEMTALELSLRESLGLTAAASGAPQAATSRRSG
jgi:probable rRNA maturation factor